MPANNTDFSTSPESTWSFPVAPAITPPQPNQQALASDEPLVSNESLLHTQQELQPVSRQEVSQPGQPITQLAKSHIWGLDFTHATMEDAVQLADEVIRVRIPQYFITANLNYLMLADEIPELAEINNNCHCILADGNPIVWRSRFNEQPLPCRVAGSDMIIELARLSAQRGYSIYFLGGAPKVAQAAADILVSQFPELKVAGCYSPPFRQLSSDEHSQLIQSIRSTRPDILLVAFGQPKGELWIYDNYKELGVPLSIQLGASFDFLAGTAKRAPEFWQKIGCEWLYRAMQDPRRLLPRYGKNLIYLSWLLLKDLLNRRGKQNQTSPS